MNPKLRPREWDDAAERTENGHRVRSSVNPGGAYTGFESTRRFRDSTDVSHLTEPHRDWRRDPMMRDPVRERDPTMRDPEKDGDPVWGRYPRRERHLVKEKETVWDRDPVRDLLRERDPVRSRDRMMTGSATFTPDPDLDDGEVVKLSKEDQELARKKKELQLIEEEIIRKKTAIAMKKVAPYLQPVDKKRRGKRKEEEEECPTFLEDKEDFMHRQPPTFKDVPALSCIRLEDKVNTILQKRRLWQEYPSKVLANPDAAPKTLFQPPKVPKSFVERMNISILSRDEEHEGDHPLKHRVKALMQRRGNATVASPSTEQVLHGELDAPSQNHVDLDPEDPAAKGFQRFLNILNKGVDLDLLSRIVNKASDGPAGDGELLHGEPSLLDSHPAVSHADGSESHALSGGVPWRDRSRSRSGERRTEMLFPDRTHVGDRSRSLSNEKSPRSDRATHSHFGSRSRSESPALVEDGKEAKPEGERQLLSVLQTIGLSLGAEEVGELTDRTQERLFGKKEEREEKDWVKERLLQLHRCSSSSSSSSSSGSSPSPDRLSSGKASRDSREESRTSKYSHTRDRDGGRDRDEARRRDRDKERGRDRGRDRDNDRDRDRGRYRRSDRDRHRDRDRDKKRSASRERTNSGRYRTKLAYPELVDPRSPSAMSTYTAAQYSQYMAYHSSHYPGVVPPSWGYVHPSGYPYPADPSYYYNNSLTASTHAYSNPALWLNPDLSLSEGQEGEQLGPRCLLEPRRSLVVARAGMVRRTEKVISQPEGRATQEVSGLAAAGTNTLTPPTEGPKAKRHPADVSQLGTQEERRATQEVGGLAAAGPNTPNTPTPPTEAQDEKQLMSEEEMKTKLKKKLEEFNLKMKQKLMKPKETTSMAEGID